jgi:hypothetical protein
VPTRHYPQRRHKKPLHARGLSVSSLFLRTRIVAVALSCVVLYLWFAIIRQFVRTYIWTSHHQSHVRHFSVGAYIVGLGLLLFFTWQLSRFVLRLWRERHALGPEN